MNLELTSHHAELQAALTAHRRGRPEPAPPPGPAGPCQPRDARGRSWGPMHPLAGSYFRFEIDEVLVGWGDTPRLFTAHTPDGQAWLVWLAANTLDTRCWLCAPASDWAIGCVMSGRALPVDLFRHSSTGTVEEITVGADGWLADSFRLCDGLSDGDVPTASRLLSPVGSSGS